MTATERSKARRDREAARRAEMHELHQKLARYEGLYGPLPDEPQEQAQDKYA